MWKSPIAFLLIAAAIGLAPIAEARIYDRCSLARELQILGVPRYELSSWICIAERESTYNSYAVGPPNWDGSHDYGIFQINDKYWCAPPSGAFSHNLCKINCNDLLSDSIAADLQCARLILREQGWKAWSVWQYCNNALPYIDDCF
ncbi:lysozyme 2-like [Musca vetustissima]|uniref:lysozyme 2-like n=1 Tax=Musca vetustissima TaxID=27455 RepID=UPI002AB676CA|nr:lysozyme 2-like [Musca vetustissima]